MATLASLDDLKARLDWELDADEIRIANSSLEDASELARFYGRDWPSAASAPRLVRNLVLKACVRRMNNPQGFTQSRAGDETLMWNDESGENAGTTYFTREEQRQLNELAGRVKTIASVSIRAWGTKARCAPEGLVPSAGTDEPFQMFSCDVEPW
jgi:hypothetical protein